MCYKKRIELQAESIKQKAKLTNARSDKQEDKETSYELLIHKWR